MAPSTYLGRKYLEKVQKGEICGCIIWDGRKCKDCIKKEEEQKQNLKRSKSINKIKKKIKRKNIWKLK